MAKIEQNPFCCIPTCRLHLPEDGHDLSLAHLLFYSFPQDPYLRGIWGDKCGASPSDDSRVCSVHFADDDFESFHNEFLNFPQKRILKKNAIPSLNLPSSLLCGTVVILNQQHPINSATVSIVSHDEWNLGKNETLKPDVSSGVLISSTKPAQVWELCRMCASSSESMIPIFNQDGSDKDSTAYKLKQLFAVNVSTTDVLPVRLCGQCIADLNFCHQLALKCAQADAALRCLVEAEATTNASQDVGSDWQLHAVSTDLAESSKQSWDDGAIEADNWNTEVHEKEVVETEMRLPSPAKEKVTFNEEVKVDETDLSDKSSRRLSTRLKKGAPATEEISKEEVDSIANENLENVPLRDRLRNKARQKCISLSCKECGKPFEKKTDLRQHLQNIHEKFECTVCEELFDTKEEAEEHESAPHTIPCPECKEFFASKSSLLTHIKVDHASKKPFVCSECGHHFISKITLGVHLKTHTGKRTTVCDTCGKAFRTCDALRQHKFVHMTEEEKKNMGFPCTMCDKKFSRRTKLEYHMRRHTGERHFTCTICAKSFHDSVRLKAHTERHGTDKKFKCDECGSGFVCKRYLTNHKSRYHRRREVIRCSVCSVVLPSAEEAVTHHKTHTPEEVQLSGASSPYLQTYDHHCRQCSDYFPSKEMLDAHKAKAHVRGRSSKAPTTMDISELIKQVDCTVCGKKLWGMGSLKRHMSSHAGSRPERTFQCEFCAKMFAQKAQLVVHIRTHTGERPHRCSFCGKGFITGQSLIKHERIHTGETPFHCTQCPKAFRSKENLILHQKTHLGLKPFECTYCHKSFGRQIHLQLHLRTHTGERPYVCDVCGRGFAQGGDMRRHKLTHTGERAYKCTTCCFSSNKRKTLRDHEALTHPNADETVIPDIAMPIISRELPNTMIVTEVQRLEVTSQQFSAPIIPDPRNVMFLSNSEMNKGWEGN